MTTKHTPGPWFANDRMVSTRDGGSGDIAVCQPDHNQEHANAAHIVRAANSHDELVAALADAQKRLRGAGMLGGDDDPVCAALAKARQP